MCANPLDQKTVGHLVGWSVYGHDSQSQTQTRPENPRADVTADRCTNDLTLPCKLKQNFVS